MCFLKELEHDQVDHAWQFYQRPYKTVRAYRAASMNE